MRYLFILLFGIHSLIHVLGFLKAFQWHDFKEITQPISKAMGLFWLAAGLLLLAGMILYISRSPIWWIFTFIGVLCSQTLIFLYWSDAKFGTIINLFLLAVAFFAWQSLSFKSAYKTDVKEGIDRTKVTDEEILSHNDVQDLPIPIQRYLDYVGAIGQPKVRNVRIKFKAEMRERNQDWFSLEAEQYSFFDQYERLFFLDAKVKGLPTAGYHRYKDGKASMDIRLLSTFPVASAKGDEMFKAETVTMFNDMCLLAPATLIDERIQWEPIDSLSTKATFTNGRTTISATLFFNEKYQLINFESMDRYDVSEMKQYKFSTPLQNYKTFNGYNLFSYGEAVWHYPEGPFTYGKFWLQDIKYNVDSY